MDAQIGPNNVTDYQPRVGYGYTGFSQLKSLSRLMNAATKSTAYEYDPLGRLVTSADFLNRPTQIFHEPFCVGNTAITPRGVEMASSFDTLCRLVQMETQEERHLYAYDELDRPTVVRVGERYAHEPNPNRVGSRYRDAIFKHDTAYEYDSLDRITKVTYPTGETVSYLYNAEGAVTQMTDVHGKITQYSYFNDGRLNTVTYQGQVFTYAYDLAGRLETIIYPAGSNLVASFTTTSGATGWNPNGQLLCLRYLKNGAHFHRFEYTYDDSGNRISLIDTPENTALAVTWDYGYDWLNRLSSVSRNGVQTAAYAYDESDNRTSLSLPVSSEVWTYGYDLADQILSRSKSIGGGPVTLVESYSHDADGNMIARTNAGITTNYDWNTLNKLRQVKVGGVVVESTSYDHGGIRRLKKDSSGPSKSYSSGAMSLCDTRPTGPVSFIQGHQLLGLEESGNCYFFITDGLSSVRVVVNSSCVSQGEFRYDEFGNAEASSTPPSALSGHSYVGGLGQRNEGASLGLYYARQRFYDPATGRFLTRDPMGFAGGLNEFGYVGQNPTNWADPSGLDGWDVARGFGKAIVAGAVIAGAVAASGVEVPAAAAWGLGSLAMGYTGCKLATGKEPITGRPIDVHEWDETAGGLIAIPFTPSMSYKGAASVGLNVAERLSVRGIPLNYPGGRFAIATHGGGDIEKLARAILSNANYRGQRVLLMSCQGLGEDAPALQTLLRAKFPAAEVEATSGNVGTLFPFPLPFSLKPWGLAGK